MIKDIHFRFNGFRESEKESQCHLRLARSSPDKPLVVVCSQYTNYHQGYSSTNGLELIAHKLFRQILNEEIKGVSLAKEFSTYDRVRAATHPFKYLLGLAVNEKYGHKFEIDNQQMRNIFDQVVWLERYPKFTLHHKEAHWLVTINSSGSPNWDDGINEKEIFDKTGFHFKDLFLSYRKLDLEKIENRRSSAITKGGSLLRQISKPTLDLTYG